VAVGRTKILQCQVGSILLDRAGHLLVLDILRASVATRYGCVDLVTRHGLLPWCLSILERDKVDKVYVKEVIAIARQVVETSVSIDQNKAASETEEEVEGGGGSKRLMMTQLELDMTILLARLDLFAKRRDDEEMAASVSNLSSF